MILSKNYILLAQTFGTPKLSTGLFASGQKVNKKKVSRKILNTISPHILLLFNILDSYYTPTTVRTSLLPRKEKEKQRNVNMFLFLTLLN